MISALILTKNESINIRDCLASLSGIDDVVVLDSMSADETCDIALELGARIVKRPFDDWSSHQNWANKNISFRHPWVLYLDADERLNNDLLNELKDIAMNKNEQRVAFWMRRRNYFMGKWIKNSFPPVWLMRFFRPQHVIFERLVNPIAVINGESGNVQGMFDHYNFSKGIGEWIEKHNRYAELEAIEGMKILNSGSFKWSNLWSNDSRKRRSSLKELSFRLPARALMRFIYLYVINRGFLDGGAGLTYCRLISIYEYIITLKMIEIKRRESGLSI